MKSTTGLWQNHFDRLAQRLGSVPQACDGDVSLFHLRLNAVRRWLGSLEGKTILDVGCGPGLMSESWVGSNTVVGGDVSREMLALAQTKRVLAVNLDALELPFPNGVFDLVLCFELIQMLGRDDAIALAAELVRVKRTEGAIVLSTHNAESLIRRTSRPLIARYRRLRPRSIPAPLRPSRVSDLVSIFRSLGIRDIQVLMLYYPLYYYRIPTTVNLFDRLVAPNFIIRAC